MPTPSDGCETVRTECPDWILIFGRRHLERVLRDYVRHYNHHRPHRGIELGVPDPITSIGATPTPSLSDIRCRDRLGGLVHEYHSIAA